MASALPQASTQSVLRASTRGERCESLDELMAMASALPQASAQSVLQASARGERCESFEELETSTREHVSTTHHVEFHKLRRASQSFDKSTRYKVIQPCEVNAPLTKPNDFDVRLEADLDVDSERVRSYHTCDKTTKDRAFCVPIDLSTSRCKSTCCLGQNCVGDASISEISFTKESFWGIKEAPAPSTKQRHERIVEILKDALVQVESRFRFYVENKTGNKREVCEGAYLVLIGLTQTTDVGQAPRMWKEIKKSVLNRTITAVEELLLESGERYSPQYNLCRAFIEVI